MFRESPPEVSAVSDHGDGDGDIQDESEEDPAAAAVDGGHQRWRRWVAASYVTQQGRAHNKGGYTQ